MGDAWIIDGVRTYRGKGKSNGALHHFHPQELLAQALNGLMKRNEGVELTDIEDVVIGCGNPVGEHGDCIGRMAVLAAGWPYTVPAITVTRFCGSGQHAVNLAAMGVISGQQDVVVAGGIEMLSRATRIPGSRMTLDGGNPKLHDRYQTVPQGISADLIATIEGFSRSDVDEFACRSQERTAKAIAEGRFDRSVITVHNDDGSVALDHEEHPRPGSTVEAMAGLKASFADMGGAALEGYSKSFDQMALETYPQVSEINHVHHAGNSSGVVDGSSAMLLTSEDYARAHGLTPRARIVATAVAGSEPVIMLTGPGDSCKKVLAKAGLTLADIDVIEINEAFASVPMKTIRDLGMDIEKVNPNGGAIALGHPIGATGPMLIQTCLDELERTDGRYGLISMCTGGGMATATIIERI
jgi:acetyl-CoA C-acetyltransferase